MVTGVFSTVRPHDLTVDHSNHRGKSPAIGAALPADSVPLQEGRDTSEPRPQTEHLAEATTLDRPRSVELGRWIAHGVGIGPQGAECGVELLVSALMDQHHVGAGAIGLAKFLHPLTSEEAASMTKEHEGHVRWPAWFGERFGSELPGGEKLGHPHIVAAAGGRWLIGRVWRESPQTAP